MKSTLSAVLGTTMSLLSNQPLLAAEMPAGWSMAGKDPSSYVVTIDNTDVQHGKASAVLASVGEPKGFGTMLQSFEPVEYRGKRLALAASIKSQDVKNWAGLWMRVDGPEQGRPLAFDNMMDRPIKGSNKWTNVIVVLDVPETATNISFGLLLDGQGKVWIDDMHLFVVEKTVPITGSIVNSKPTNLDFEQ